MRYSRLMKLVRRTVGALALLGSVGVSSDTITIAQEINLAALAPLSQPQGSDDIYKRAGDRLAQQMQQISYQNGASDQYGSL